MLKFKTSCAVLAYLSSNLLNEVGLSLFRYFEVGLRVCDIVVKKFTFAISSPDEFLFIYLRPVRQYSADVFMLTIMCDYSMMLYTVGSSLYYISFSCEYNACLYRRCCVRQRLRHSVNE